MFGIDSLALSSGCLPFYTILLLHNQKLSHARGREVLGSSQLCEWNILERELVVALDLLLFCLELQGTVQYAYFAQLKAIQESKKAAALAV